MKKRIIPALVTATLLVTGFISTTARADSSIPIADFYKKPQFGGAPLLAPDGNHMAVLTPRDGRFVLAIINLDSRQSKVVASDPDWNISDPYWLNNKRLVFRITKGSDDVMENQKGGGLFAVNVDGSGFRKLAVTFKEAQANGIKYDPVSVLQRVGGDSNELFVVNNERGRDADFGASDVFRLDTTNGRKTLLTFNNPGNVSGWLLDHANVIRVATSLSVDADKRIVQTVFHREDEKAPWKVIYKGFMNEGKMINPLGFDFDNKTLFVAGRFEGRDKYAVYTWDFAANKAGQMVADHPMVDIGDPQGGNGDGLRFDIERKKIVGVAVAGMKEEMYFFDEDYARIQSQLEATLPDQQIGFSWRGDRAVVLARGDNNVGKVYFFDTKKKTLEPVFSMKPELDGKKLSPQTVISYAARDGMTIPAYLTMPEGLPAKGLPLVVDVHGGPHARDHFGYDAESQMLASRGYVVLKPQFRMSTGFGWKHHTAGWRQWGLAMQDDVTDGVKHLIKQGIVDPNRVCIMGGSYGGYATMYGLVKDPDLYKCGINVVGVTDVKMLFSVAWSDMSGPVMDDMGVKMHGDPKDAEYMKTSSAIENAHKIKAPVLMVYGSEDIRVPLIHGEKMRDKLLKQGNSVDWVVMVGEGHGWSKESNRIQHGETVMKFIDRHIGPSSKAAGGK